MSQPASPARSALTLFLTESPTADYECLARSEMLLPYARFLIASWGSGKHLPVGLHFAFADGWRLILVACLCPALTDSPDPEPASSLVLAAQGHTHTDECLGYFRLRYSVSIIVSSFAAQHQDPPWPDHSESVFLVQGRTVLGFLIIHPRTPATTRGNRSQTTITISQCR